MPSLCRAVADEGVNGRFSVAEVLGSLSEDDVADYIRAACVEKGRAASVGEVKLRDLPASGDRAEVLADNGTFGGLTFPDVSLFYTRG